ncbi:MAG: dihydrofolate reductase family protein [Aggregatilineales bacterium]
MGKVIAGMSMSLDGYVNDRDGSAAHLYPDMDALHESDGLQESMENTGAVVMGRRSYDMAQGDYTGYEYQVPIFVVTHNSPETVAKGENDKLKFNFVTAGVERAIEQAKSAAGDKQVTVIGGADVIQQLLRAGLVDELEVLIMPILLGGGTRLFGDDAGDALIKLDKVAVSDMAGGTNLRFRVMKNGA